MVRSAGMAWAHSEACKWFVQLLTSRSLRDDVVVGVYDYCRGYFLVRFLRNDVLLLVAFWNFVVDDMAIKCSVGQAYVHISAGSSRGGLFNRVVVLATVLSETQQLKLGGPC